ncbi:hypothetical protein E2320_008304, partial [Naja naja]
QGGYGSVGRMGMGSSYTGGYGTPDGLGGYGKVVAAEIVVDITGKATWEEVAGVECIEECHCVSKACWKETVLGLLGFLTKLKFLLY